MSGTRGRTDRARGRSATGGDEAPARPIAVDVDAASAVLGRTPNDVVRPNSISEVAVVVAAGNKASWGVIPWGGGTSQDLGYPPKRADVLMDLTGLDRVTFHSPADLVITVQGGATLASVQAALRAHGQFLPLDPPGAERATVGGILSTNDRGPWRTGYGTARDWLIGLTIVDGRGRVVRGGGKVVKNVTGYDLPKLYVGALGTLGVIVEATFKVAPLPEAADALLFDVTGAERDASLDALLLGLSERRVSPAVALLHEEDGRRHLFVVWNGRREAVQAELHGGARLARDAGLAPPLALDPETFAIASPADTAGTVESVTLRFSGMPDASVRLHRTLAAAAGDAAVVRTMPLTGEITVSSLDEAGADRLLATAAQAGAASVVLHAPLTFRERPGRDLWAPLPASLPLQRSLKAALDPGGVLNPGRFVGGI